MRNGPHKSHQRTTAFKWEGARKLAPSKELLHMNPVEPGVAAVDVMEYHVSPSAGVSGNGDPIRRERCGRTLNDVAFSGHAWPTNRAVLTRLSRATGRRSAQTRVGISWIGAGNIFLPIVHSIAIRIGGGLRKQVIHGAEVAQAPRIRNAIV